MLRGDARGHRTAAHRKAAERACARLPLQRRRHHAGGGQNPGNVRPQRDRGGQHQRAFGRFEAGLPHRHGADPCRPAADGADQRQFGVGGGDRRRGVAGPRPRGADRPAQFRQGTRAVAPTAGLQCHAQTHHGQILHPLGPLHPGHRLFPFAGRFGARGARLADLGVHDPRGPQGLRRRRRDARHRDRPGVHFTLRPDALRAGIHRGFRRRIHAPQPRPADRHPHLLDHGQGLRRLRGVHARQEGPLRIGHPPGAQGAEKSRRGRPFRRLEEQVRAGGGRVEGRHADQPRNLPHAGRRDDQQRHRHAPRLPGRRDRALAVGRQGGEKGRRGARRSRRVRPNHPRAGHQAQVQT